MANLFGSNVMSISFIYRFYFLLHSHSDQLKYYPLFLIFLCCSCLCTLSLSSDCLSHVVISWIIDAKCMSIFDRLFTFWCSPTLAGCPTALCFTFPLFLLFIYSLCVLSISIYTSKCPFSIVSFFYFFAALPLGRLSYSPLF